LCRIDGNRAVVGHEYMVSKHRGGRVPPSRFRLAGRKGQRMKFVSHRRGRTAVPASIATRQATYYLNRARSGALVLGLAAAGSRPGRISSSCSRCRPRSGGTSGATRASGWMPGTEIGCRPGSALIPRGKPNGGTCWPRCAGRWRRS
jgi:hypothetical protein